MPSLSGLRVFSSGLTELWADGVRPGHRMAGLGERALEVERPLHAALDDADTTLCGTSLTDLHEYPVNFEDQEKRLLCPRCDELFARRGAASDDR